MKRRSIYIIIVNGMAGGTWTVNPGNKKDIEIKPFGTLNKSKKELIKKATRRYLRFKNKTSSL